jgi:dienelactone hydrolase
MKYLISTFCLIFLMISLLQAQPFSVGRTSINVYDASRSGGSAITGATDWGSGGRVIGTELFYPSLSAGSNTQPAAGQFPIVVFGHGFVMTYDSYDNIGNALASKGYIVAFPITEGGFSPEHAAFAADILLLAQQLPQLNTITSPAALAIFNGHVRAKAAIGGHSMGAGCSMVAAQLQPNLACLFSMATATSNTTGISSLAGAPQVSIPSFILSGERDCVADTTVQTNHYTALASAVKFHMVFDEITHCDFGNGNSLTCTFGQSSVGCPNTIANATAFGAYMSRLEVFLRRYLYDDCQAGDDFMQFVTMPGSVLVSVKSSGTTSCSPLNLPTYQSGNNWVVMNPVQITLHLKTNASGSATLVRLFDMSGHLLQTQTIASGNTTHAMDVSYLTSGLYVLLIQSGTTSTYEKILIE